MKINLKEMLASDDQLQKLEHDEKEVTKKGNLRAGNSGIVLPDGMIAGACPRKTWARWNGVGMDEEGHTSVMFEAGRSNEDIVIAKLKRKLPESFTILTQDQCATSWTTPRGTTVSGSPDVVVVNGAGQKVLGIELKMIASVWTAQDVMFKAQPKLAHLIQAAHYMKQLDMELFKLMYISYVHFALPFLKKDHCFPKEGEPKSELLEYNDRKLPKKILPFRQVFDIKFNHEGLLAFREEDKSGVFTPTPISWESIANYFDRVEECGDGFGDRPLSLKATGDFEEFNTCDYCELKEICNKYETKPARWLEEMKKLPNVRIVF